MDKIKILERMDKALEGYRGEGYRGEDHKMDEVEIYYYMLEIKIMNQMLDRGYEVVKLGECRSLLRIM